MFSAQTLEEFLRSMRSFSIGTGICISGGFLFWWIPTRFNRDFWKEVGCVPQWLAGQVFGLGLVFFGHLAIEYGAELTPIQRIGAWVGLAVVLVVLFFYARWGLRMQAKARQAAGEQPKNQENA